MGVPGSALPRRLVLAAGAALLLPGCTPEAVRHATSTARSGDRADSPALPADLPTAGLPAPTSPGDCPRSAGTPSPTRSSTPQRYVPCTGTNVALTLDDGPSPQWTEPMLALLDRHHVRATFSLIGRQAAAHPGLVAEIVAAGHTIANHSYTHPDLATLSRSAVEREITRAGDAIEHAAGRRPVLFRAPGGAWSSTVLALCAQQGLRPLAWSVDPRDWSRPGARQIAQVILRRTRPGSIILEHDGGGDRSQTYRALSAAIPMLQDAGYTFTTP
ncbi:MAG TPA: polysaccharide deacetylase family protein [Kineosporiaceae bacterium]